MSGECSNSNWQLQTPVVLCIFNRPDTTERVFAEIAKAKPPKLLVVADGPRPDRQGEDAKCAAARAIIEGVDWDCEVLKNYAEENLGAGRRISSGLDWVFSMVNEAIILEDDCLPHPTFFRFCEELLERFRLDNRVMTVNGSNFQFGGRRREYSYYFSRYPNSWGWATWKRAWRLYDFEIKLWPELQQGGWLKDILGERRAVNYWENIFNLMFKGQIDTWDYQWIFCCWINNGLSITPNVNLVSNIGCKDDATHTTNINSIHANLNVTEMDFPLHHPPILVRDDLADSFLQHSHYRFAILVRIIIKLTTIKRIGNNYIFKYLSITLLKLWRDIRFR